MWSWTADERYALAARDQLRALNERMTDGYGDWHYLAERFMRAIPLLVAGGFLSDADIHRTDHLLMLTALGNQDEWWRMRLGTPPLGHRHQGKGTYEFLLVARYLRGQAQPTPALRTLCDRWIGECCTFLDALAAARGDDQDDESCLNNIATIFRYALRPERHAVSPTATPGWWPHAVSLSTITTATAPARAATAKARACTCSRRRRSRPPRARFITAMAGSSGISISCPISSPRRHPNLHFAPVFLQKFDTGPELVAVPPDAGRSIECLPVTDHQFAISNQPPVHYEPAGHMVNAIETWHKLAEAIALNRLPPDAWLRQDCPARRSCARNDAYLMIEGTQGGFRWQGHMQAANCIARFFQAGHVFLVEHLATLLPRQERPLHQRWAQRYAAAADRGEESRSRTFLPSD